jgi:hypothetical protein
LHGLDRGPADQRSHQTNICGRFTPHNHSIPGHDRDAAGDWGLAVLGLLYGWPTSLAVHR